MSISDMSLNELREHRKNIQLDMSKIERELSKSNTNHILHLLFTLITCGFWLLVWIPLSLWRRSHRTKFEQILDEGRYSLSEIEIAIEKIKDNQ